MNTEVQLGDFTFHRQSSDYCLGENLISSRDELIESVEHPAISELIKRDPMNYDYFCSGALLCSPITIHHGKQGIETTKKGEDCLRVAQTKTDNNWTKLYIDMLWSVTTPEGQAVVSTETGFIGTHHRVNTHQYHGEKSRLVIELVASSDVSIQEGEPLCRLLPVKQLDDGKQGFTTEYRSGKTKVEYEREQQRRKAEADYYTNRRDGVLNFPTSLEESTGWSVVE